jgi:gliding motility-associated-like protein
LSCFFAKLAKLIVILFPRIVFFGMIRSLCILSFLLMSFQTMAQTTVVDSLVPSLACPGSQVSVYFTPQGTFNPGNLFAVLLSNQNGAFQPGTLLPQTSGTSPIVITIPLGTLPGTTYHVRVGSSNPLLPGDSSLMALTVAAPVALSGSISVSPNDTICPGDSVTFTANIPSIPGTILEWRINGVPVANQTSNIFGTSSLIDADVVTLNLANTSPCITGSPFTTPGITIREAANPVVSATAVAQPATICQGSSVTITGNGTNGGTSPTYQWLVNGVPSGTTTSTFSTSALPGNAVVKLVYTSSISCATNNPDTVSVALTVTPKLPLEINLATLAPFCAGSSGTLNATANSAGIIRWYLNGTFTGTLGGAYGSSTLASGDQLSAHITNPTGCVTGDSAVSDVFAVTIYPKPTLDLGSDILLVFGTTVEIIPAITPASPGYGYYWPNSNYLSCYNCARPKVNITNALDSVQMYTLAIVDENGCRAIDSVKVTVRPNYEIFIPSAFTPNGDDKNDVLYVRNPLGQINKETFVFRVFDQFGEKVFESNYQNYGWDGTFRNEPCAPGVYVYSFTGEYIDNKPINLSGRVLLIK